MKTLFRDSFRRDVKKKVNDKKTIEMTIETYTFPVKLDDSVFGKP